LAKKEKFSGYLFTEKHDSYRLNVFLDKLKQHQINVYPLTEDFRSDGKLFDKGQSYYLPLAQSQYKVIQALFNQGTNFQDNTFYDVSGWTMPLAMDINFQKVGSTWGLNFAESPWTSSDDKTLPIVDNAYAYAFEWQEFLAPKLLNKLLAKGIKAKVATKTFSSVIKGENKHFSTGTIVIPAGIQTADNWQQVLSQLSNDNAINLHSIDTGLTIDGVDIGSGSIRPVNPVKVLLVGGKGSSQYEAAEVLYYLDDTLNIPVTVVERQRLAAVDLNEYSHILMVDGNYEDISDSLVNKFKAWLKQGGVVFAQKRAGKWLAKTEILKANFVTKEQINELFATEGLSYQDKEKLAARKRIAGAIFETTLDTSHPLTFGFTDNQLPLFKNSTLIIEPIEQPFLTVAQYSATPLMSGYADRNLENRIANNPALVAHNYGKGRVIVTPDILTFRGYWLGSAKLLANSLFFAKAFSAPTK